MRANLKTIIEETKEISSAPQIVPKLKRLLDDPNSELDDSVRLIKQDISLTAKVLKQANSSYYGIGAKVDSLEFAVQRFGFKHVQKMVLLASATSALGENLKHYEQSGGNLLEVSICCAELMSELAASFRFMERDAAYTLGLFHAVGKIVVDDYFSKKGITFYEAGNEGLTLDAERKLLGFDHAEAGAALLEKWNFSETIIEPLRLQYSLAESDEAAPYRQASLNLSLAAYAAISLAGDRFEANACLDQYQANYPELWTALEQDKEALEPALEQAGSNYLETLQLAEN